MDFVSIRIITADIRRLVAFHQQVTGIEPNWYTEDFAELRTAHGTLAIASERTMAFFAEGAARGGDNRSVILELRVADVDAVYARVAEQLKDVVQKPTTMPWGNRSLLFRDPDGNLINLFTPTSADAIRRADGAKP